MSFVRNVINQIKWKLEVLALMPFRLFPVNNNKVFVCNSYGAGYGDNGKYICQELLKANSNIDIVWAVSDMDFFMPKGIRKVKYKTMAYYYEMATSKIWLDNCRKYHYIRKRKGQFYIQTWHADIGLKKAEGDALQSLEDKYIRDAMNDSKMIDLFVTGNDWFETVIRRAYWYDGPILKPGYPRRDIFYKADIELINRIKGDLGIKKGVNIFFYAPTFRHGQDINSLKVYNLDWGGVKVALQERFGGEWQGMVRLHPNLAAYYEDLGIPKDIINVNRYPDMQELLLVADVCISDYSSGIFDFGLTEKVGFLYAEDVENYKKDRGLLFDFDELPFSLSQNNSELIENILKFDMSAYKERIDAFYNKRLHFYDDGFASRKVVEIICKKCR